MGLWFIVALAAIGLAVRVMSGSMDRDRIGSYLGSRGGRVRSAAWAPMARGWAWRRHTRTYDIVYEDDRGNVRQATARTGLGAGVWLTDDRVLQERVEEDRTAETRLDPETGSIVSPAVDDLGQSRPTPRREI
jgi:hypothetical protein